MRFVKLILMFLFLFAMGSYTVVAQNKPLETKERKVREKQDARINGNEKVKRKRSTKNKERRANSKSKVKTARKRLMIAKKNQGEQSMTKREKAQRKEKIAKAEEQLRAIERSIEESQQNEN